MKKWVLVGILVVGAVCLFVVFNSSMYLLVKYNSFVTSKQNVTTSWAQVETQYQRRFDLIPNLVEATKGTLRQEQAVFVAIANARKGYAGTAPASPGRVKATGMLDSALARLLVVIENYPELKSNETVRDLMNELAGTENRINVARFRYNEVVQDYDTSILKFPGNLIASSFGFKEMPYYKADEIAQSAPKINLEVKP